MEIISSGAAKELPDWWPAAKASLLKQRPDWWKEATAEIPSWWEDASASLVADFEDHVVDRVSARVEARMRATFSPSLVMQAQTYNRLFSSPQVPGHEVVFPTGDHPSEAPHNLPKLLSAADVDALSHADAVAYCTGHVLAVVPGAPAIFDAAAKTRLKVHLGF